MIRRHETGEQELTHLIAECAYEHWHRMLFARFLAENQLLIHSELGVPVTLAECEELARVSGRERWLGRWPDVSRPGCFRPSSGPATPFCACGSRPSTSNSLKNCWPPYQADVFTAGDAPRLGLPVLADQAEEGSQSKR